ncbi:hypothetical protein [Paraburkholderia sp.]|uniref:hypothetical protein n=1 Tax=Paraburkholderia sp. TaxID=1926495 RepID=UPI00257F4DC2|nr:hypothetical protein [Paraburkholderia sp.]
MTTVLPNFDGFLLNPDLKKWLTDKDDRFLTLVELLKNTRSIDALVSVGKFFMKIGIGFFIMFAILNAIHLGNPRLIQLTSLAAIYSITVFLCIKTFRNPVKFIWDTFVKPSRIFALILVFPVFDLLMTSQPGSPSLTALFYGIVSHFMILCGKIFGFNWPQITNHWFQAIVTFISIEMMVIFVSIFIGAFYVVLGVVPFLVVWLALLFVRLLSFVSPKGPLRVLIVFVTILVSGYFTFF